MSREAMKLALEALESCNTGHITDGSHQWYDERLVDKAIATLQEALAEQPAQQEPVAWMSPSWIDPDTRGWQSDSFESIPIEGWLPLYTSPPAQRTWVGLTDDERAAIGREMAKTLPNRWIDFDYARAVEAKLKEKNT